MATRISSCESESNLHHCFRCFVPMRALQFVLESLANRACCLLRAADTRSRIALEGPPTVGSPYHGTQSMALHVEIDPIEQRSGNALPISLHLTRPTAALAFQIAEVTTRARVHRRHQHEFARESNGASGS